MQVGWGLGWSYRVSAPLTGTGKKSRCSPHIFSPSLCPQHRVSAGSIPSLLRGTRGSLGDGKPCPAFLSLAPKGGRPGKRPRDASARRKGSANALVWAQRPRISPFYATRRNIFVLWTPSRWCPGVSEGLSGPSRDCVCPRLTLSPLGLTACSCPSSHCG